MIEYPEFPKAVCPKCGETFWGKAAVSRSDNRTPICPDCGAREALAAFGCTVEEQERILVLIHEYERAIRDRRNRK